ncbi:MAG: hypothetical protein ACRD3K_10590 [Edaphobacter sp.]
MSHTDPLAGLEHLLLQLAQNDVRLGPHQSPHPFGINAARSPALRNPTPPAGLKFCGMDLRHPAIADLKTLRQLPQSPLAGRIRTQHLLSQIVTVRSGHIQMLTPTTSFWKESKAIPQREML